MPQHTEESRSIHSSSSSANSRLSAASSRTSIASSLSAKFGSKAFSVLYPNTKTKTTISHLKPRELVWFVACLKNVAATYNNDGELNQRTEKIIRALPKHLQNPLEKSRFTQASLTRFCAMIGASDETLPQASHLCRKHSGLSAQLTSSARNYIEYVAEDLSEDILGSGCKSEVLQRASAETLALIHHAENAMALTVEPREFMAMYPRSPKVHLQPVKCDACFMSAVLQDPDMICALRGIALRAHQAGIVDEDGTSRTRPSKLLLEACIATFPKQEALLMIKVSDAMAEELAELVDDGDPKPREHVRERTGVQSEGWSTDLLTGEFKPDLVPQPLKPSTETRNDSEMLRSNTHRIRRKPVPISVPATASHLRSAVSLSQEDTPRPPLTPRQLGLIEGSDTPPKHEDHEAGPWQQMYKQGRLPFSQSHTSSLNVVHTPRSAGRVQEGSGEWDRAYAAGKIPFPFDTEEGMGDGPGGAGWI